jgi:hypothetical protein
MRTGRAEHALNHRIRCVAAQTWRHQKIDLKGEDRLFGRSAAQAYRPKL